MTTAVLTMVAFLLASVLQATSILFSRPPNDEIGEPQHRSTSFSVPPTLIVPPSPRRSGYFPLAEGIQADDGTEYTLMYEPSSPNGIRLIRLDQKASSGSPPMSESRQLQQHDQPATSSEWKPLILKKRETRRPNHYTPPILPDATERNSYAKEARGHVWKILHHLIDKPRYTFPIPYNQKGVYLPTDGLPPITAYPTHIGVLPDGSLLPIHSVLKISYHPLAKEVPPHPPLGSAPPLPPPAEGGIPHPPMAPIDPLHMGPGELPVRKNNAGSLLLRMGNASTEAVYSLTNSTEATS